MIVCLLAARNCADDVPEYLACAGAAADTVIALDDGSTDATAELLAASERVTRLLHRPRRESYEGWDDGLNRRELLDAAVEAGADWVLFLDADERMDADDAGALRGFIGRDALRGCAYGLQVFRSWDDRVAPEPTYAYRLFAPAASHTLPARRLHFNPVPREIPRAAWVRTTIRIRHLDSVERTRARRRKYEQADPRREFETESVRVLEEPPERLVAWAPRAPGMPVIAD